MPTIEQLRSLLEKEPEDDFLNFGLAMALRSAGQGEEALRQFDRTIEVNPDYVPAHFLKGQLLAELERVPEARQALETGIERAIATGDEHARGEMAEYLEGLAGA